MGTTQISRRVAVDVSYGVGESCQARFSRGAVEGLSARALVSRVIEARQVSEAAARTAQVLGEVLSEVQKKRREIDVELARGDSSEAGDPIVLDDVVVRDDVTEKEEEYSIRISESYRGGVCV